MDKVLLAVKYVEGDLNEMEHKAFEEALMHDGELQGYLVSYREINCNLGEQLKEVLTFPRFKSYKSERNEEYYLAEKISYGLDYLWFSVWGLVAVIALLIWQPWKSNLYDEFGYDNKVVASKLVDAPYQGFETAAKFLEKKHYYEAKLIVSKKFLQNPEDFKLASCYAMVLIADNRLETGREILFPFVQKNSIYKNDAAYMLALTYLKAGDVNSCKNWLRKIDKASNYYQQSVQLLDRLNEVPSENKSKFS